MSFYSVVGLGDIVKVCHNNKRKGIIKISVSVHLATPVVNCGNNKLALILQQMLVELFLCQKRNRGNNFIFLNFSLSRSILIAIIEHIVASFTLTAGASTGSWLVGERLLSCFGDNSFTVAVMTPHYH